MRSDHFHLVPDGDNPKFIYIGKEIPYEKSRSTFAPNFKEEVVTIKFS